MSKLLKILGAVAPTVASALGGPMAGLATHTLGKVLLGKDTASEEEISNFILANQNPEILAKLRLADHELKKLAQEHELRFEEIAFERDRMHVDDRISARAMAKVTRAVAQGWITGLVLIAMIAMTVALFIFDIPEDNRSVVYIIIGALAGSMTQVMNFWFGSSAGSKEKTRSIDDLVSKLAAASSGMDATVTAGPGGQTQVDVEVDG